MTFLRLRLLARCAMHHFSAGIFLGIFSGVCQAGAMESIQAHGLITLGVREGTFPISYRLPDGTYSGYNVEICLLVVDAMKQELGLPQVRVRFQPVTSANRLSFLLNKTIDMDCSYTPITQSRQALVAFSVPILVSEARVMVSRASGIQSLQDLNDKPVATGATGTTLIATARSQLAARGIRYIEVPSRVQTAAFQMLLSGQVLAVIEQAPALMLGRLLASNPGDFFVLDDVLNTEMIGVMMRRDDKDLLNITNRVIIGLIRSGGLTRRYQNWFMEQPAPGTNVSLDLPMPALMRQIIDKPETYISD